MANGTFAVETEGQVGMWGQTDWQQGDAKWRSSQQMIHNEPIAVCSDGCQMRDLLFVENVITAVASAIDNIRAVRGRAFNVSK